MKQLKINNTSTPYWCVVVPVDAEYMHIYKSAPALEFEMYGIEHGVCLPAGNWSIIGCITLSEMDEGVRELVDNKAMDTGLPKYIDITAHESALSLLQHNQITLTADTKAVVVKQKI